MALDRLLKKLAARGAVTPVTPAVGDDVTAKPAPAKACTSVTPVTPQHTLGELLAQFRLQECENDPDRAVIARINNIAFFLITQRAFDFDEAVTAAAQWVANNPPHHDEAAFTDVTQCWRSSNPGDADRH
jgi:hypothetical protein